jgi:3-oxoacyl-[acyl-carrier protein] reductase
MKILVTGALGGIGSAIVKATREAGHTVYLQDLRSSPSTTADIEGDLNNKVVLDTLRTFCRENDVDSVVAAHGIAAAGALSEIDEGRTAQVMRVNTLSVFNLYESVKDLIMAKNGSFLVVSSQAGIQGEANNGIYCASKFAILGWAKGLKAAGSGPRLRVLCPGATETPLLVTVFEGIAASEGVRYEDILARRSAQVPAGRLGRPDDIGAAALWLLETPAPAQIVAAVTGGEVLY